MSKPQSLDRLRSAAFKGKPQKLNSVKILAAVVPVAALIERQTGCQTPRLENGSIFGARARKRALYPATFGCVTGSNRSYAHYTLDITGFEMSNASGTATAAPSTTLASQPPICLPDTQTHSVSHVTMLSSQVPLPTHENTAIADLADGTTSSSPIAALLERLDANKPDEQLENELPNVYFLKAVKQAFALPPPVLPSGALAVVPPAASGGDAPTATQSELHSLIPKLANRHASQFFVGSCERAHPPHKPPSRQRLWCATAVAAIGCPPAGAEPSVPQHMEIQLHVIGSSGECSVSRHSERGVRRGRHLHTCCVNCASNV